MDAKTTWPDVADKAIEVVEVSLVVLISVFWCAFLPVTGILYLLDMLP